MTPEQRAAYDRICKIQGSLFKLIGNIESIKIALASEAGTAQQTAGEQAEAGVNDARDNVGVRRMP